MNREKEKWREGGRKREHVNDLDLSPLKTRFGNYSLLSSSDFYFAKSSSQLRPIRFK